MVRPIADSVGVSFAYKRLYENGTVHKGVDFSDGKEGHEVVAAVDGVVTHAGYGGWGPAYGQHVVIRSTLGGRTRWHLYGHLKTQIVKVGQKVDAGQKVGTSGGAKGAPYSGNSTGPHLHFQLGYENRYDRYLDPTPALEYEPASTPSRWYKVAFVNHNAASAALAKRGAKARWLRRRHRLVNLVKSVNADVIGGLECGGGSVLRYLSVKYAKAGYVRVPGGKTGRHIWVNPKTVEVVDSGSFDPPRYRGNDMPAPWIVARLDGSLGMFVLSHLDFRAPSADFRVKQQAFVIDAARKVAEAHGIGPSRIVFAGDTASANAVRKYAFEAAGWRDAFSVAAKAVGEKYKSYNEYRAPRSGPRVSLIAVYEGKGEGRGDAYARPVLVVSQRLTTTTDHHIQAAVIGRQS